jgi:hypothetical protein
MPNEPKRKSNLSCLPGNAKKEEGSRALPSRGNLEKIKEDKMPGTERK